LNPYSTLGWKLPTIAIGLALVVLSARRSWLTTRFFWLLVALAGCLWLARVVDVFTTGGLFGGLGLDFGLYWAQARVLLQSPSPGAIYDTSALAQAMLPLAPFANAAGGGLVASPVPYPPLFAWLLGPFARMQPPAALLTWTIVNAAAGLWLSWRVAQFFIGPARWRAFALTLMSVPVVMALSLGQPIVLLACAFGEFYISLRAGRDVRAGLWLSLLMFKPLYGVLIGPYLIWKRRWGAVAGAVLGVVGFVVASLLCVGPAALVAYPNALDGVAAFYGESLSYPALMINWRSIVVTSLSFLPEQWGLVLTLAVSLVTVLRAVWGLRDARSGTPSNLAGAVCAVTLTTLIASYHSNVHGAALLCVPLGALLASGRAGVSTRFWLAALVLVPYGILIDVVFQTVTGRGPWPPLQWAPVVPLLMGAALVAVLRDLSRSASSEQSAVPGPA
jgi:hypothetical protein